MIKSLDKATKGKPVANSASYLKHAADTLSSKCRANTLEEFKSMAVLNDILNFNATYLITKAHKKILEGVTNGAHPKAVWDRKAGLALVAAAEAH